MAPRPECVSVRPRPGQGGNAREKLQPKGGNAREKLRRQGSIARENLHQAGIAGFEIAKAKREAITKKSHKTTSGVFRYGDKTLICMMGSNNIPKDAGKVISKGG